MPHPQSTNQRSRVGAVVVATAACLAAHSAGLARAQPNLFSEVTQGAGITLTHTGFGVADLFMGTGAAWFDYNGDQLLDLYVTQRVGANSLFENQGNGTFLDVAAAAGVRDAGHDGAGVSVADYDNDGLPDIYLANTDGDVLFRNNGDGTFSNVTTAAGLDPSSAARGTTAAWGDFNRDGWLDLYVVHHRNVDLLPGLERDRLYQSNGDGTFTDVTDYLDVLTQTNFGFAAAWTDIDDDADPDILIINDCPFGPRSTHLLRNDGPGGPGWQFTDVTDAWGVDICDAGMGIAVGDYDRDGHLDYFNSDIGDPTLYHNLGDHFEVATHLAEIQIGYHPVTKREQWTWGANFFDCNLDGWLDLYVCAGANRWLADEQPNVLCFNNGDGTFTARTDLGDAADTDRSRTSVVGDYDGDGDLDVYVVNYEQPARLYRNDNATGNHFLGVRLRGTASNRDGIGARMRLTMHGGLYQYHEVRSGSSLGGGDEIVARFGLGIHTSAAALLVR
jgi:hypothetical protein